MQFIKDVLCLFVNSIVYCRLYGVDNNLLIKNGQRMVQ